MNAALFVFCMVVGGFGAARLGVGPFAPEGAAPPALTAPEPTIEPQEVWDLEYGAWLAEACLACHGAAETQGAPRLAGRPAAELRAALESYASGARPHDQMGVLARSLTPEERGHVAAWFAAQPTP